MSCGRYGEATILFNDLGFKHEFECVRASNCEPPDELVIGGEPAWRGEWLAVHFIHPQGQRWEGRFAGVDAAYPLTGVFGTPDSGRALVVNQGQGYWVDVLSRRVEEIHGILPIRGVRAIVSRRMLLLHDFQRMATFGPSGALWRNDHVCDDDLEILDASNERIRIAGQDAALDAVQEVTLDPETGRAV